MPFFVFDSELVIDYTLQAQVAEYHNIKLEIGHLEKKMMSEITRPERVLYYLLPGRLVCGYVRHFNLY